MRTRPRKPAVLATVALLGLLAAGCSSGGNDEGGGGGGAAPAVAGSGDDSADGLTGMAPKPPAPNAVPEAANDSVRADFQDGAVDLTESQRSTSDGKAVHAYSPEASQPGFAEPRLISRAQVSLHSDDVARTRVHIHAISDKYDGSISADETSVDEEGDMSAARTVLRIPSDKFTAAEAELEKVADLVYSQTGSDDVTQQIIDVHARIRAQEESLSRVEALLAEARTLRQVIAIESQLTRRQADLDSLKRRQAYLADQTQMSTITVYVERTPDKKKKAKDDDDGFLAGLGDGWDSLVGASVGLATFVGLMLPWTIVLLLIGWPLVLLVRRLRPLVPALRPAAADEQNAVAQTP